MRANQIAEQRTAARSQQSGETTLDLLLIFGLDAAPRVDDLVTGHVDRGVRIDVMNRIRFEAHGFPIVAASSLNTAR